MIFWNPCVPDDSIQYTHAYTQFICSSKNLEIRGLDPSRSLYLKGENSLDEKDALESLGPGIPTA